MSACKDLVSVIGLVWRGVLERAALLQLQRASDDGIGL
ncbi:hypothetical protein XHC_1119 [Xanthomonas hortorum pv. carotae str. M081]|nr:hypothetical protein XHC_1119 [Xanthomonas hortorum pv. carotae str. M081]